jgi:hypothetical protein
VKPYLAVRGPLQIQTSPWVSAAEQALDEGGPRDARADRGNEETDKEGETSSQDCAHGRSAVHQRSSPRAGSDWRRGSRATKARWSSTGSQR